MRDNRVIQGLALAAALGAAASMAFTVQGGWGPAMPAEPHRAAGTELARQALAQLKPGGQVMLITRDTITFPNPATDLVRDSFLRTLRRAHVTVAQEQKLEVDPLRRLLVPASDFLDWIHHGNSGDVIVSLMGPPVLAPNERALLGEIKPAIVAFCPGNWTEQVDFRRLFSDGQLSAAVVTRSDFSGGSRPRNTPPGNFAEAYQVVTKANVDAFVTAADQASATPAP